MACAIKPLTHTLLEATKVNTSKHLRTKQPIWLASVGGKSVGQPSIRSYAHNERKWTREFRENHKFNQKMITFAVDLNVPLSWLEKKSF